MSAVVAEVAAVRDLRHTRPARMVGVLRMLAVLIAAFAAAGCGAQKPVAAESPDKGAVHIHGIGVDPADGALLVATHSGLFRAPAGEQRARRIGTSYQDTMGFTVAGPSEYLGSGHPDARSDDPPLLGLIRSNDAGRTWQPVSLRGEVDFHVLRFAGTRLYGVDSQTGRLFVTDDGGRSWARRTPPAPVLDLAADPAEPDELVAATERGLALSRDGGGSWRVVDGPIGYLAWDADAGVSVVDGQGLVWNASAPRAAWERTGEIGGRPAAFTRHEDELYVALHDGTVKRSTDGGATWELRARA